MVSIVPVTVRVWVSSRLVSSRLVDVHGFWMWLGLGLGLWALGLGLGSGLWALGSGLWALACLFLLLVFPAVAFCMFGPLFFGALATGKFRHIGEAMKFQYANAGFSALYGRAAVIRGLYVGHGVLSLNFARHKVEQFIHNF